MQTDNLNFSNEFVDEQDVHLNQEPEVLSQNGSPSNTQNNFLQNNNNNQQTIHDFYQTNATNIQNQNNQDQNQQQTIENQSQASQSTENLYEQCQNCQRQFFQGKLKMHQKLCTKEKPFMATKRLQQNQDEKSNTSQISLMPSAKIKQQQQKKLNIQNSQISESQKSQQNLQTTPKQSQFQQQKQQIQIQQTQSKSVTPKNSEKKQKLQQLNQRMNNNQQEQNQQNDEYEEDFETNDQDNKQNKYNNNINNNNDNNDNIQEQNQQQQYQYSEPQQDNRIECNNCGRKFMEERIEKHVQICAKTQKKRKVFNSLQKRVPEGQDPYQFVKNVEKKQIQENINNKEKYDPLKAVKEAKKKAMLEKKRAEQQQEEQEQLEKQQIEDQQQQIPAKKEPKWKQQHKQFQRAMKRNKNLDDNNNDENEPEEDPIASQYVTCQYCTRKFQPDTAERHIPLCKNIINRPKPFAKGQKPLSQREKINQANQNINEKKQHLQKGTPPRPPNSSHAAKQTNPFLTKKQSGQYNTEQNLTEIDENNTTTNSSKKQFRIQKQRPSKGSINIDENKKTLSQLNTKRAFSVNKAQQKLPELNSSSYQKSKQNTSNTFYDPNQEQTGQIQVVQYNKPPRSGSSPAKGLYEGVYARSQQYSSTQCPHCDRNFAKQAAERHIPICKTILNRPKPKLINGQPRYGTQQLPLSQQNMNITSSQNQKFGFRKNSPKKLMGVTSSGTNHTLGGSCNHCGTKSVPTHKYCGNCGKKKLNHTSSGQLPQ